MCDVDVPSCVCVLVWAWEVEKQGVGPPGWAKEGNGLREWVGLWRSWATGFRKEEELGLVWKQRKWARWGLDLVLLLLYYMLQLTSVIFMYF